MELHDLKSAWQHQMQQELENTKMSLEELSLKFQSIEKHGKKTHKENRFWLTVVLAGIAICIAGFIFFTIQYTPERFPHVNIKLYTASFTVGITFLSLNAILMYFYNVRYKHLQTQLFTDSLKDSLLGIRKNFQFVYRLSIVLCVVLLPPLFYLWLNYTSPIFNWSIHHEQWIVLVISLLSSLFCILTGHAMTRYFFNKEITKLNSLLSALDMTGR